MRYPGVEPLIKVLGYEPILIRDAKFIRGRRILFPVVWSILYKIGEKNKIENNER